MSAAGRGFRLIPSRRIEAALDAEQRVRASVPVVCRVSVVSLSGGVGCTTAARRLATVLASRRIGAPLLVDATGSAFTPVDVAIPGVDTARIDGPVWPDGIAQWRREVDVAHRQHEFTITDWGPASYPELAEIGAHSHVVCVATSLERTAVQRALDAAGFLADSGVSVIIVASAVRGRASVGARAMLASAPVSHHLLPHDAGARNRGADSVSGASAFALVSWAADVATASRVITPAVGVA